MPDRSHPGRAHSISPWLGRGATSQSQPEPGFWSYRMVRNGPEVACCIRVVDEPEEDVWWEGSPNLAAYVLDEPASMERVWTWHGTAITEAEYRYRCALVAHCKVHDPSNPLAKPWKPIDLTKLPPIGPE